MMNLAVPYGILLKPADEAYLLLSLSSSISFFVVQILYILHILF